MYRSIKLCLSFFWDYLIMKHKHLFRMFIMTKMRNIFSNKTKSIYIKFSKDKLILPAKHKKLKYMINDCGIKLCYKHLKVS